MKNAIVSLCCFLTLAVFLCYMAGCNDRLSNTTAKDEQSHTEENQRRLDVLQPAPMLTYSLERENLRKRELLQNDRTISFYMYVFLEGYGSVGYYQINKVSSVNSQLTNPMQIIYNGGVDHATYSVLPSPAEDGSYGTNGDGVFGFTPEDIYIEHNMKYIVATTPLQIKAPFLALISTEEAAKLKATMDKLNR